MEILLLILPLVRGKYSQATKYWEKQLAEQETTDKQSSAENLV